MIIDVSVKIKCIMRAANSPNYAASRPFNPFLLTLRENKSRIQKKKKNNTEGLCAVCLMAFTRVSGPIYNLILRSSCFHSAKGFHLVT